MPTLAELLEGIQCPRCGRENTYSIREVEEVILVEGDTVTVTITVGECDYCGERLLDDAATQRLEEAARKVRGGTLAGLTPTGTAYHYP